MTARQKSKLRKKARSARRAAKAQSIAAKAKAQKGADQGGKSARDEPSSSSQQSGKGKAAEKNSGFGAQFSDVHPSSPQAQGQGQGKTPTTARRGDGPLSSLTDATPSYTPPWEAREARRGGGGFQFGRSAPLASPMELVPDDMVPVMRNLRDPDQAGGGEAASSTSSSRLTVEGRLTADEIRFRPVQPLRSMHVANLAHGLDRVLFNPGVHVVRDARTGIYNYDPSLTKIPDVDLFDFQVLTPYVTSSQDKELRTLAQRHRAQFCGSTSSLTAMLSQVYFLVSGWKSPDFSAYSESFRDERRDFTDGARLPASIVLRPSAAEGDNARETPTRYAVDADKATGSNSESSNYVLTQLGKSMEKMLTVSPEEFQKYLRVNRPDVIPVDAKPESEAYHYALAGKSFLMRSQLDCSDDRLPGKTFDLKSRAVITIRSDRANWVEASGYQIKHMTGLYESFERERYDMTRAAFLKYYLQARIGCMDGIFVAYHNAARFFGFEYFPIEEMAKQIFGTVEMADQAFKLSIGLSERVLERATELYPGEQVHLTLDTQEISEQGDNPDCMRVFVQRAGREGEAESEREVRYFDVVVDRFVNGRYARGAIDFKSKALEQEARGNDGGGGANTAAEESSTSTPPPPPSLTLDYAVVLRDDVPASTVRNYLSLIRAKQTSISQLVMPNIDAVNDRERRLQAELARNPLALQRYAADKKSGVAIGLPRAPGQVDLFSVDEGGVVADESDVGAKDTGDAPSVNAASSPSPSPPPSSLQSSPSPSPQSSSSNIHYSWRKPSRRIDSLRELSRKGAASLLQEEERNGGEPEMYERRS